MPREIKFNEFNYREHGQVKHYSTKVRLISLNVVGQCISQLYVLKKYSTILCKSTLVIGEYPSGEGLEFLRGTEQPSRYSKIYLVWLQLSEGKQSASWRLSSSPASSVRCMAGGDFLAQEASLVTTVMTVKTHLQRSLSNY